MTKVGHREAVASRGDLAGVFTKPPKMAVLLEALIRIFTGAAQQDLSTIRASRPRFDARMARELPLRILVAEDNTINQKLMFRLLSRLGYHADVAANGMEALESLRRQPYDVILMDVQMPEMDGTDAARAIINGWPTPQRPRIVALTAAATKEDRDGCLAAGMDDYLSKPVRMDELVAALRRCAPGIQ